MVDSNAQVQAEGAFISTEQLAQMMASYPQGKLTILNAAVKPEAECDVFREHAKSHIPGARFLDLVMVKDLASPYPFMMPDQKHFVRMMKALDVRKSSTVVVYETGKGWFATRAAFMLKAFGHPNVFVLDGNFAKWTKENRPVEGGDDASYESDYDYALNSDNMRGYEQMKAAAADGSIQIIDSRPPPAIQSSGSIPGSINIAGPSLMNQGVWTTKTAEEIREIYTSKGVDLSKPMAFSCTAGVLASMSYACAVKAGFTGSLYLYDGSWSEYAAMQKKEQEAAQQLQ